MNAALIVMSVLAVVLACYFLKNLGSISFSDNSVADFFLLCCSLGWGVTCCALAGINIFISVISIASGNSFFPGDPFNGPWYPFTLWFYTAGLILYILERTNYRKNNYVRPTDIVSPC